MTYAQWREKKIEQGTCLRCGQREAIPGTERCELCAGLEGDIIHLERKPWTRKQHNQYAAYVRRVRSASARGKCSRFVMRMRPGAVFTQGDLERRYKLPQRVTRHDVLKPLVVGGFIEIVVHFEKRSRKGITIYRRTTVKLKTK